MTISESVTPCSVAPFASPGPQTAFRLPKSPGPGAAWVEVVDSALDGAAELPVESLLDVGALDAGVGAVVDAALEALDESSLSREQPPATNAIVINTAIERLDRR